MGAFVVSGALGLWLHHRANVEFERELAPDRAGVDLFWTAIRGASPPALAPATLIHLGLLGTGVDVSTSLVGVHSQDAPYWRRVMRLH